MEKMLQKLKNHKKLNENDCINFIKYETEKNNMLDYINKIDIKINLSNCIMEYNPSLKKINLYPKIIKNDIFNNYISLEKNLFSNCYNDFYNLNLLYYCFHELAHISQCKQMKQKEPGFSLLFISTVLKDRSDKYYHKFHNNYYIEYKASITAMLNMFNFIQEKCNDCFSVHSLELLNKYMCNIILSSYFIKNSLISPLDFNTFLINLMKYQNDNYEKIFNEVKKEINDLNELEINDLSKLFMGLSLSDDYLEKIKLISNGNITTINFIDTINKKSKVYSKKIIDKKLQK